MSTDFLLSTSNRRAYNAVTQALNAVDAFRVSRNIRDLEPAAADLEMAVEIDPGYQAAQYYLALVDDLRDNAPAAADRLMRLLPVVNDDVRPYIQYALALSQFHRYGHENLNLAEGNIRQVIESTQDDLLQAASHALLARVYSMLEIPKLPPDAKERAGLIKSIRQTRSEVDEEVQNALKALDKHRDWRAVQLSKVATRYSSKEIRASALNAQGASKMYQSDYEEEPSSLLSSARGNLEEANELLPEDWAIVSNLGSCLMRVARLSGDEGDFELSRSYLLHVVEKLRPEYGFALYEIGRTYRLQGHFADAETWLRRAKDVPRTTRGVGDYHIDLEMDRAHRHSTEYP